MARVTYRFINGEWVEADKAQTEPSSHGVIQDSIDPFRSHADGKIYDSKSTYRRSLRAMGLREVGNDNINVKNEYTPKDVRADIHKAINRLIYKN